MLPPVVFHHGLFGYGELRIGGLVRSYFNGVERAVASRGFPVIVSSVHPTASITTRARQLKETILQRTRDMGRAADKVILIAHSMGGLDARHMISRLGMDDRVTALVTISTPHRGSPYADWCIQHLGRRLGGLKLMSNLGLDVQGCIDVTCARCGSFNSVTPDMPGVRYFSVSAARPWHRISPFGMHSYKIIHDKEGDNDGLVSVRSAIWGEHLGTWPADHWHTINRRLASPFKDDTGDIIPYYLRVFDHLTREGLIPAHDHTSLTAAC